MDGWKLEYYFPIGRTVSFRECRVYFCGSALGKPPFSLQVCLPKCRLLFKQRLWPLTRCLAVPMVAWRCVDVFFCFFLWRIVEAKIFDGIVATSHGEPANFGCKRPFLFADGERNLSATLQGACWGGKHLEFFSYISWLEARGRRSNVISPGGHQWSGT